MASHRTKNGIWAAIEAQLREQGIDVESLASTDADSPQVKVVCVSGDMHHSVAELGKSPRGQVVMVRVDDETSDALDAWVESGAVRSRSEAAALFIREGLKVRSAEFQKLRDALGKVEQARQELRARAREVIGAGGSKEDSDDGRA